MDIATGALSTLLPKLGQLLQDEYNLQRSTRKEIEFLSSELQTMHAALRKVGEVPREQLEELQKIWARDVRELSYDMDDIVDTFMVHVEGGHDPPTKSSAKKFIKKMIKRVAKATSRHEIAQEIKEIRQRIREVADRHDRHKVDAIDAAKKTPMEPRISALYTKVTELVGIGKAKEEVIIRLTKGDADKERVVVSIAGFGGLGKTTLAKAVYEEIKRKFDCTAFISMSRNPDTQKLLKDMLYQFDDKEFGDIHKKKLDERLLIDQAIKFLKNKRYIIVIDDIWNIEPWKIIACALIENNMGSRIITTTRIIGLAEQVGGCYRLKALSDQSSEVLFYGRIFDSKYKCPRQFLEVSKKILKKCGGVPLAIVTTSSMLANKSENITKWYDVCDSIGSGLSNPGMDDMRKILLLSYYDLPPHLKTCLLYLSIFPEDYEIRKDTLIWRWVAEGFVQKDQQGGDQSFLGIGESYFNELVNRSLIQPADIDIEGTPQACRVHDTVLDLIISLSVEECFISTTPVLSGMESKQIRRLSLHNNSSWPTMKNMPKLRSLTIFAPGYSVLIDPSSSQQVSRYRLLRVLDLGECMLEDLASLGFVGSLSHLRYLALSSSTPDGGTDWLPVEIGKLRFLQTLDVSKTRVKELPSSIIGLGQLICLLGTSRPVGYQAFENTRLPADGLKNLTSLEVLERVAVTSKCIAEELGHLTQLRVLRMVTVELGDMNDDDDCLRECTKALVESLGKLRKIESIYISYNEKRSAVCLEGTMKQPLGSLRWLRIDLIEAVPAWIEPALLPALSYLDLEVEYERREDIQGLGMLPCLRYLRFTVSWFRKHEEEVIRCVVGPDAFPCVEWCELFVPGGVAPSMFPRGAMPRLQNFTFQLAAQDSCGGGAFYNIDDLALAHLPSLRDVTVWCPHSLAHSVKAKLRHEQAAHPNNPRFIVNPTAMDRKPTSWMRPRILRCG